MQFQNYLQLLYPIIFTLIINHSVYCICVFWRVYNSFLKLLLFVYSTTDIRIRITRNYRILRNVFISIFKDFISSCKQPNRPTYNESMENYDASVIDWGSEIDRAVTTDTSWYVYSGLWINDSLCLEHKWNIFLMWLHKLGKFHDLTIIKFLSAGRLVL